MKRLVAAVVGVCLASAPVFASRVTNRDNKKYTLTVVPVGGASSKRTIQAKGELVGLCSDKCTFKIKGSSIVAGTDDHVIIENGQLSIQH